MLKPTLPRQHSIGLVPRSGLQFLDFGFDAARLTDMPDGKFAQAAEDDGNTLRLDVLTKDPDSGEWCDTATGRPAEGHQFSEPVANALTALAGHWIPAPIFRERGQQHEAGPVNWARMLITELEAPDDHGNTYRVTVLIDTDLAEERDGGDLMPVVTDAQHEHVFSFASELQSNSWFLRQSWVTEWLRRVTDASRQEERPLKQHKSRDDKREPLILAPWASYITLLRALASAIEFPKLHFIDTLSGDAQRDGPVVEVDLVLDVGNSRTCGLLIEDPAQEGLTLRDAAILELRDLTQPHRVYNDPFPSHVEFRRADFGDESLSRDSGRDAAMRWPSLVRVGPEAVRLAAHRYGTEGLTGLSAPKRYLWDEDPTDQVWLFNAAEHRRSGFDGPVYDADICNLINSSGDVLVGGESAALDAHFSRASLFTFMLLEVMLHAMAQINAPAHRMLSQSQAVPRRLRRVILTVPTGTPIVERRLFEKRVEHARKLLTTLLGWDQTASHMKSAPDIHVWLDEATCTQMGYLYAEVAKRFAREPAHVVKALSKDQDNYLRVASLDIGGGTTDLTVTRYSVSNGARLLEPQQEFCEGFRRAGDDILEAVIAQRVLPAVERALGDAGMRDPGEWISRWMNESSRTAPARQTRQVLVSQVLVPLGLQLLAHHEATEGPGYAERRMTPFKASAAAIEDLADNPACQAFEGQARDAGAAGFRLRDLVVEASGHDLEQTIDGIMGNMLAALSAVVGRHDCDILLLSGRPSRLPAVIEILRRFMPVPPHRIQPMHRFRVGDWYRFASPRGEVGDPKTTVVVGALIGTLANDRVLHEFAAAMDGLQPTSTARFIGPIDGDVIRDDAILFDDRDAPEAVESEPMRWDKATFIGFRQLGFERWPATPLYIVRARQELSARERASLPWKITFGRPEMPERDGNAQQEPRVEELWIEDVEPLGDGGGVTRDSLSVRLQTLRESDGYWLDTGFIKYEPRDA